MDELARPAIEALRERRVRYHPESQHRFAIESLEQAPDWCVSRQLWWGHQIPIWTCPDGHLTCAWPPPGSLRASAARPSSSATPTSSTRGSAPRSGRSRRSGGPNETAELARYYPGDVNSTAREIIRLWENRMIFAGLFLLGEVPFTDVIIHSTVLAADGRRMSKSLGTGVDPMEPIEAHGADATRYGLLKISSTQDVRYSVGAIEEGRKLANKLWNVARLILQHADGTASRRAARRRSRSAGSSRGSTRRGARSRTRGRGSTSPPRPASSTTSRSTTSATGTPRRSSRGSTTATKEARATALRALELLLSLLHPLMPHVTEEIWSQLPTRARLIVSPLARAGRPAHADAWTRSTASRRRLRSSAAAASRSSWRATTSGGSSPPSCGPSGGGTSGDVEAERARLGEGDRARRGDARERALRRERARRRRRGRAREARALPARARAPRLVGRAWLARHGIAWLESLSPWPRGRLRRRAHARAARRARRPAGGLCRRSTSSARTASRRRRG